MHQVEGWPTAARPQWHQPWHGRGWPRRRIAKPRGTFGHGGVVHEVGHVTAELRPERKLQFDRPQRVATEQKKIV